MKIQNLLTDIKNIRENISSQTLDDIYHDIFNQIANDHRGVYFDDKIWVIEWYCKFYLRKTL